MLHHVSLEAGPDDRAALVEFISLLGFEEVDPPEGLRGLTRWLQREDRQVHVMFVDEPVAPPLAHFAVVAEDYEGALERLRRAGYEPESQEEYWGSPRSFVAGPGGHRVEVMAFPPGGAGA